MKVSIRYKDGTVRELINVIHYIYLNASNMYEFNKEKETFKVAREEIEHIQIFKD